MNLCVALKITPNGGSYTLGRIAGDFLVKSKRLCLYNKTIVLLFSVF